jgi:hypothetical protein
MKEERDESLPNADESIERKDLFSNNETESANDEKELKDSCLSVDPPASTGICKYSISLGK